MNTPELPRTERLQFQRMTDVHFDDLLAVYGDLEAMRFVGDRTAITEEDCRLWIEVTKKNYAKRGYGMFAVQSLGNQNTIGFMGLVHPGDQVEPELKYAFLRSHWGQGFATEAAQALLAFGQEQFALGPIIATTDPENTPSHRVLIKCGMRRAADRVDEDGVIWVFTTSPAGGEINSPAGS